MVSSAVYIVETQYFDHQIGTKIHEKKKFIYEVASFKLFWTINFNKFEKSHHVFVDRHTFGNCKIDTIRRPLILHLKFWSGRAPKNTTIGHILNDSNYWVRNETFIKLFNDFENFFADICNSRYHIRDFFYIIW